MQITTLLVFAPLAPLALGLLCAFVGTLRASAVVNTEASREAFEAGLDRWMEYEASEEAYNARQAQNGQL